MDFFEAQDQARRKTGRLVMLFAAAVVTLVLLTNVLVAVVVMFTSQSSVAMSQDLTGVLASVPKEIWLYVTLGVVGTIAIACGFKFLTLGSGGKTVAEMLGGAPISSDTRDPQQRRLLNVVEEMAIASGLPVPPVYLIPEASINAFAAGFGPDDAVLGFNQGTLDQLNRSELQGVVAHEFSHLLNGDTRINLRLIALLHGILFIGLIGRILLRGSHHRGAGRSRGSSGGGGAVLALGGGLMLIGYGGTFFGNLIKAAVSRQREYLADGSAVQFTRNPEGIADALKKIGGLPAGALMTHPQASEASHMLFGQGVTHFLGGLMATHPPLPDRIRALQPNWNGAFISPRPGTQPTAHNESRSAAGASAFAGAASISGEPSSESGGEDSLAPEEDALEIVADGEVMPEFDVIEQAVATTPDLIGNPNDDAYEAAEAVLLTTTHSLRDASHDPVDARALVFAMLLSPAAETKARQLEAISKAHNESFKRRVQEFEGPLTEEDHLHRLGLVQAAMPALKAGSRAQFHRLMGTVVALIKADETIDLFEWVLYRVLVKELRPHFEAPQQSRARYNSLVQVEDSAIELLSALAGCGGRELGAQKLAYSTGMALLPFSGAMVTKPDPGYSRLGDALETLRRLKPLAKPQLLKACAAVALADDHVTVDEGALLQGVSTLLDCPLPPAIYRRLKP